MIIFENNGLMPLDAATTFGLNVKLGENPIGFFGTGLKYAIAVCLRLGGTFRLFLGTTEYEFYLKKTDFRGESFNIVHMKKRKGVLSRWQYSKLSYTTDLGKHWEPWMAVRELESNMRDEAGSSYDSNSGCDKFSLTKVIEDSCGENRTVIIIECLEMEEAYGGLYPDIFRDPDLKLIEETALFDIYEGESNFIYYRGLRVTDLGKPSLYTYDFKLGISLTEDRTSKWPYSDGCRIQETIFASNNMTIIDKILDCDEDKCYEGSLGWDQTYATPSTSFEAAVGGRMSARKPVMGRVKNWYNNIKAESDPEAEMFDVSLSRKDIKYIMNNIGHDDISKIMADAIDEEIPF